MVGHHRWLSWINNPTFGSNSEASAKQEQEITLDALRNRKTRRCHVFCPVLVPSALCLLLFVSCVALSVLYNSESDCRPEWKNLLSDYQNISERFFNLTKANRNLTGDNENLKEHSATMDQQTKVLNRTADKLRSVNLALSLESTKLMEQILNLTSTNLQLTQEHERLLLHTVEQEEEKLNMTQTIRNLVASDAQRAQEERRLSEINSLLRDELLQVKEENQELLQINGKFQGEIKNLSEQVAALSKDECEEASKHNMQLQERRAELQEQNQNLSRTLMRERKEAAEREESRRHEMDRMVKDMQTVDLYCPVVNHRTKERSCKKCQNDWRLFENKCYYFSSRTLTWSSSRAWCRTQGGDLLIINSEPEQSFVFESSQAVEQSATRLWIGMTDAEEEGEWLWVDGSSVASDVQFWLSRPGLRTEPDDWKLENPLGEDCGHIDTSEHTLMSWMDGSCETPYRWICEKSI